MLPTPDLSHLKTADYEHIYEPAEDSFIFLDALEADASDLLIANPKICLEIGSGSGCISAFIAKIIGPSCLYLCTDINSRAALATSQTGIQNKVHLNVIVDFLTNAFNKRIQAIGGVDVLLFNPPYVPTEAAEVGAAQNAADIQGSWAGGSRGMEITDKVLDNLENLLSPKGRFYLVAIKQNNVPGIQQKMKNIGFDSQIILKRRAGGEFLYVVRFVRLPS